MMRNRWLILSAVLSAWVLAGAEASNLLVNGGFETELRDEGGGWVTGTDVALQGTATLSDRNVQAGRLSLRLKPNVRNVTSLQSGNAYAIAQGLLASNLVGKRLYLSAWMNGEGGATAVIRIYAHFTDGRVSYQELRQKTELSLVLRRDVFDVPDDSTVAFLIVMCLVEGRSGAAYFDEVSLTDTPLSSWPQAIGAFDSGGPLDAAVSIKASSRIRRIPSTLFGSNLEWIWDGNGVWDGGRGDVNPRLVEMARQMGGTLYRFPGGIFADFYHWQDGVGPLATRSETESMPGGARSVHRFGTDEALAFSEAAGGELLITVNVVTGTPEEAAAWVRYVNATRRRVRYWEIGNESYVAGNAAHIAAAAMTPDQYARRFVTFARSMRAVDPAILIGAIVDENYTKSIPQCYPGWTEKVLEIAAGEIDFLSVHAGYAPALLLDNKWNPREVYSALLAAPKLMRDQLESLSRRIAEAAPNRAKQIGIAVTEWGPYFSHDPQSPFVDHTKTLGSALFVGSALKTFVEAPAVTIANSFKLVDNAFMGWIGIRGGSYTAKPSYEAFRLFVQNIGSDVVESVTSSPTYDTPKIGWVDAASTVPYLDVVTSISADGAQLFVFAVNKHFDRAIRTQFTLADFNPAAIATAHTLAGTGVDANTGTELPQHPAIKWAPQATVQPYDRFPLGSPTEVTVTTSDVPGIQKTFEYTFPPGSITVLSIPVR